MKIVTCIKQVPDTVEVTIDKETGVLVRDNVPAILNPFDAYAIEEGILIRDACGGEVTAITMGPPQALAVLHDALSVGVDNVVHICDSAFRGSDTYVTAKILAAAIKKLNNVDLILCGKQAIDGDTAQVGPEIAELLEIPHVAYVKKIREVNEDSIVLERMTENGIEVIKVKLPAMLTVLKDINTPRLPSFKLKRAAKGKTIPVWGISDIGLTEDEVGLKGSPTTVMKTFTPKARGNIQMLSGSDENILDALLVHIDSAL